MMFERWAKVAEAQRRGLLKKGGWTIQEELNDLQQEVAMRKEREKENADLDCLVDDGHLAERHG